MNKTVKCAVIALISLVCVIVCVKQFLATGNGLWAIWAVLACAVKVCAIADAVEDFISDELMDRMWKGGSHE